MTDFAAAVWAVAFAAWVAFVLYAFWLAGRVWKDRLMRCPETGAITLVGIAPDSRRAGKAPEVEVQHCALWPEKKDCARGCLARYDETSSNYRLNVDVLRSFERN